MGAWRAENLPCLCARWGRGQGQPGRGGTLTHTPPRPPASIRPKEQAAGSGGWEDEAGPRGSVSEGISDEPGARVSGCPAASASGVLPSLLNFKPREGQRARPAAGHPVGECWLRQDCCPGHHPSVCSLLLDPRMVPTLPLLPKPSPSSREGTYHNQAGFNNSQTGHTHCPQACRAVVQQHKPRCAGNA